MINNWKMEKAEKKVKKVLSLVIFLIIFIFSLRGIYGEDIWFHLSTGRYIFENRRVPLVDVFSHTAEGKEWINQNWLSDTIFYLVYRAAGDVGLGLFFSLQIVTIFYLLYRVGRKLTADEELVSVLIFLASFFAIPRFQARPETGSYVFIVLIVYLLMLKRRNLALLLTPLIFLIWSNWQSGFVAFGFAILIGSMVYDSICFLRTRKKLFIKQGVLGLLTLIISGVASLLNPVGSKGVFYFLEVKPGYLIEDFTEWGSVFRIISHEGSLIKDVDFRFMLAGYILFGILFVLLLLINLVKNISKFRGMIFKYRKYWAISLIPFLFTPFFANRFIPLAIITLFIFSCLLYGGKEIKILKNKKIGVTVVAIGLLMFIFRVYVFKPIIVEKDNKRAYREEMMAFIKGNHLQGAMFNPLEDGGYFIWNMPEVKVFVDQRLDVYTTSGVYEDYRKVYSFPPDEGWEEVLEKYNIQLILLPGWQDEPLSTILESGRYSLVYWSDYFFLLLKNSGVNHDFARENQVTILKPFKKEEYQKGELDKAIQEALVLKDKSPISANILVSAGNLYQQKEMDDKAIEYFEKSLGINDKDDSVRLNLGTLYAERKECDTALLHFGKVERGGKRVSKALALRNMGFVYMDCYGNLRLAYKYFAKFVKSGRKYGMSQELIDEARGYMKYIRSVI